MMTVCWIESFNIRYFVGVDGVSISMVLLTAILCPICILASWNIEKAEKGYFALFLLLDTAMTGVFCAMDFFLFFIYVHNNAKNGSVHAENTVWYRTENLQGNGDGVKEARHGCHDSGQVCSVLVVHLVFMLMQLQLFDLWNANVQNAKTATHTQKHMQKQA